MNEERLFETLSRLETHQAVTNERLANYNFQLTEHIKRTALLEKEVHTLWKWKWMVSGAIVVATFVLQILGKALIK